MSVGAGIISIITESLYDKPIVVFREYVQNSIDAFYKDNKEEQDYAIDISVKVDNRDYSINGSIIENSNIFILDNGTGIADSEFLSKMRDIATSTKKRIADIGYKGIGRLSGISYCNRLTFVDILDYESEKYRVYSIDCKKFREIKNTEAVLENDVESLMDIIGKDYTAFSDITDFDSVFIQNFIKEKQKLFKKRNTGFLVVMEEISKVLADTISSDKFVEELSWLLPVGFKEELFNVPEYGSLIKGLSEEKITDTIPAKGYPIYLNYLNDDPIVIERPITTGLLRDCVCKRLFVDGQENIYAVAFYTFSNFKLTVDKKNLFSGIKVYIDNMLLCDENELLSVLKNLNLTTSTQNELMVSVKAVGVMLYIVDKVNLSANARRTFIDITDNEALAFLKLISSFITEIYDLRYALSKYAVGIDKYQANVSKVEDLRNNAQAALDQLSQETVKLPAFSQERHTKFEDLSISEQKKIVKRIILAKINEFIKSYFAAATEFKEISAFEDFKTWLLK